MKLQNIMRELALRGVRTSIEYNKTTDQFYLDLHTETKSDLHLYEDGTLLGRYGTNIVIDLDEPTEDLMHSLCIQFSRATYGRSYYQKGWAELCQTHKIYLDNKYY